MQPSALPNSFRRFPNGSNDRWLLSSALSGLSVSGVAGELAAAWADDSFLTGCLKQACDGFGFVSGCGNRISE
jgi:hypothetical protein